MSNARYCLKIKKAPVSPVKHYVTLTVAAAGGWLAAQHLPWCLSVPLSLAWGAMCALVANRVQLTSDAVFDGEIEEEDKADG